MMTENAGLSPLVRRTVAPNPSPMTGGGTNTYLVGRGEIVVIDPGPGDAVHVAGILAAAGGDRITRILLTHGHPDHAPAAPLLARRVAAPILSHEEGLPDGQTIHAGGASLEVLHTPGHTRDHLCFWLKEEKGLFSGDLVMSGSTVVIAPPEGDMAAYLTSLERLRRLPLDRIYPGHGDVINEPAQLLEHYVEHRLLRERQILDALRAGPARIPDLVARIYAEVPVVLHRLAAQSVHAHLLKLRAEGRVHGDDPASEWHLDGG
jgi:glyoxylase-like metal-dependent hydrolase (beta-lactamase superfamily II)